MLPPLLLPVPQPLARLQPPPSAVAVASSAEPRPVPGVVAVPPAAPPVAAAVRAAGSVGRAVWTDAEKPVFLGQPRPDPSATRLHPVVAAVVAVPGAPAEACGAAAPADLALVVPPAAAAALAARASVAVVLEQA